MRRAMIVETKEAIACRVCGGDPRASVACAHCRGAGIGMDSPDGYLIWGEPVDDFTFAFRSFRFRMNAAVHLLIAVLVAAAFGAFAFHVLRQSHPEELLRPSYWISGHWSVILWWFGMFLFCFLIFRLRAYGSMTQPLPTWGLSRNAAAALETKPLRKTTRDVSVYFQPAAWAVVERAYDLAKSVHRAELRAVHLFTAALSSPAGGIFATRLGLSYDQVMNGLVELLRREQSGEPTRLSREAKSVLLASYLDARAARRRNVGVVEIFLQAYQADPAIQEAFDAAGYPPRHVTHVAEWIRVQESLKEEHDRFVTLAVSKPKTAMNRTMTARPAPLLDQFSEDLTQLARGGYVSPLIGREREMEELLRAIESGKRSVVLVGEHGVGKVALVEGLARRMVEEDVPKELFDRRLVSVHLAQLISSGDPTQAGQRLLAMLRETHVSGNIILALHGIEALVGVGSGGSMDLAETLASELQRGVIVIGTTTPSAWTSILERRTLGSLLARVQIPPLEADDAVRVLMAKSGYIEYRNGVFFSYGALEAAVRLAGRYVQETALPESAIGVAQEAAVLAKRERGDRAFVTADDVARIIHEKTNIPVEAVNQDETEKLLHLEERLRARVIGQEEAVVAVAQAMRRARAEIREGKRPIANFLFLGPTGVGKTELSKALAEVYFGSETQMARLDMSEYQDRSSVARVIGTPGDERGGLLTEAIRRQPFTIVLLDELEKAHPDILTLFLQVMDDGRITDGVGRTVDCTNIVLIATSNAGTVFLQEQTSLGTPHEQIKTALLERELRGTFRPEFLNRFDSVIVFRPLTMDHMTQIAWLMIGSIAKRMEEKGIAFQAEDEAVEELARAGYDPLFGARPLRRVLQERVENALADLLLRKAVHRRDRVRLLPGGKMSVEPLSLRV